MKIVTFTNLKGGIGKTTLSVNLALRASEQGLKVALVDLDTQAHASKFLGEPYEDGVLSDKQKNTILKHSASLLCSNKRIIPDPSLFGVDLLYGHSDLNDYVEHSGKKTETLFKNFLQNKSQLSHYDLVIIDSPPASIRQQMPLMVSDLVILPLEPVSLCMDGCIEQILALGALNVQYGIVINRYNRRNRFQQETVADINGWHNDTNFNGIVFGTLSYSSTISDQWALKRPIYKLGNPIKSEWVHALDRILDTVLK